MSSDEDGAALWTSAQTGMERLYRCRHCYAPIVGEPDKYISHIIRCHGAFGYKEEQENGIYVFTNWTESILEEDAAFYDDFLFFDGKYFLSSGIIKEGVLHEWVSILGSDEEAEKYAAKVILKSPKFDSPRVEWTIGVTAAKPRHEIPPLRLCSAVPVKQTLSKFLVRNAVSDQGEQRECVWKQCVKMIKLQ